ncbi:polysaccharide deacetylase family protein [Glaciimonas sp. PCH181]|uniref:polysaccharide deacetylase family protein n=1 Tax=Glaciimonas sp. PCH181 TaxID=2133943 RepID=UPI000D3A1A4B|nr:polysaccharide deacetylase family protein [Glaciimonas sp. PCH181]PUA17715.1 polysaccharide deacetylase [Glaciimonas sp. PCH181]
MLTSHNRFPYSAITERPQFNWPGEKRLAVHLCLNLEHFAYNEGLGLSYSPGIAHPNTYNWAWREYGNRVGVWRIIDLCNRLGLPLSVLLNSACYDHCPQVLEALRARGDEILGHGRTNSEHQNNFSEAEERVLIQEVTDAITQHEGRAPAGWLSPGVNPSNLTPDLLQEAGYSYILDWPLDDQPVWINTRNGRLLSVPYPHEVNDIPAIALHDTTAEGFANMIIDNFDEMLEQSADQPLVFGISIHAFLIGQPYRLRHFRRAMEHIAQHRDKIWFTTTGAIAQHFIDHDQPAGGQGR